MLVPLLTPYEPFATGTVEYVATPGAAMFTSPPLPLSADARERSALQRLVERRDREHRRAVRGSADGRPSAVARCGDDERPGVQGRGRGLLVVGEVRLAHGDRRAQRHRDHVGALLDGPLDAGQDPAARAAALIAQHLADDEPRAVRDAVAPLRARGRLRSGGRAGAVRAVRVAVLHRLPGDERLARDDATREVGVAEVDAGVEHRDPDVRARPRCGREDRRHRAHGLEAPRVGGGVGVRLGRVDLVVLGLGVRVVVVPHRRRRRRSCRTGTRRPRARPRGSGSASRRPLARARRAGRARSRRSRCRSSSRYTLPVAIATGVVEATGRRHVDAGDVAQLAGGRRVVHRGERDDLPTGRALGHSSGGAVSVHDLFLRSGAPTGSLRIEARRPW